MRSRADVWHERVESSPVRARQDAILDTIVVHRARDLVRHHDRVAVFPMVFPVFARFLESCAETTNKKPG